MRHFIVLVAGALAAAVLLVPAAQADVARYQTQSGQLTAVLDNGNVHVFDIVISPCNGSFAGTGVSNQLPTVFVTETITGQLDGTTYSFLAKYTGAAEQMFPNYQWFTVTPGPLGVPIPAADNTFPGTFLVTSTLGTLTSSSWKNHGDYVSSQPQGFRETAATSCIGKPIP